MALSTRPERGAPHGGDAVCKEEFEEREGWRGMPLCMEQFVQNGDLVHEIAAKTNGSVLHAVILEDEPGKVLEEEGDGDAAKGEEGDGSYSIGPEPEPLASQQPGLGSRQLSFSTTCSYLPTYFSDLNTDPPLPETQLNHALPNHAKSQDQAELYCLNVTGKVVRGQQSDPISAAGSPEPSSAAPGDVPMPEQIQEVNRKRSLGHAARISARCAEVSCTSQQSHRLSSFEESRGPPDGPREKECPSETPEEPAAPAQKKKRTFYSAEQLDELERMFQEDHYPGNEKRREIAAALGVTPQRIMVWFQNRRAKWRKIEKLTVKGNQECSTTASAVSVDPQQSSQGATLLPVPQLSDTVHYRPAALMLGTATISCSSMLRGQAALLASTSVTSVTGRTSYESFQTKSISKGIFGSLKEDCFPAIPSPPPIRRASLPLNMVFNPNNHIVPLMLDTPNSEYSPSSQENSSSEAFTYSIQSQSINLPGHCSYPEQLEPTANLETPYYHPGSQSGAYQFSQYPPQQMAQLHHFPIHLTGNGLPSVHLTPATPSKSSTTFFSLPGNGGLVTYGTAEGPPGYLQNHITGQRLMQPSAGNSGSIPAFQAVPWNEHYIQGAPLANQLCAEMPPSSSGGGCCSAEQAPYTQNQSVPPSSCLLQVPKAALLGSAVLFSARQMAPAGPNSNTDHQAQAGHMTPLEENSDIDNIQKDEESIADFSEERKN